MFIQSRSNPKIKHIRQLAQRKYRQKSAQFVIEGATLILEALQQGWQMQSFYRLEGYVLPDAIDAPGYVLSSELMDYVSQLPSSPEILAVFLQAEIVERDPQASAQRSSAWILADRLQDPGNFGALLRLADALNWQGIMAFGDTPDPFQMKVIRGSMGASLRLPIVPVTVADLLAYQQQGWQVVATAADAECQSVSTPLPRQMILALGHEGQGLDTQLREIANLALAIPIHARVESLNVVTAGAMLAHEYLRQHGGSL